MKSKKLNAVIVLLMLVSAIGLVFVPSVSAEGAGNYLLDYITVQDDGGTYNDVYYDGTYIYTSRGTSGISVYTFDGADFTLVDTNATTAKNYQCVYANGTYVYAGTAADGMHAFTFDGTDLVYVTKNTTGGVDIEGVFANATYIFGAADNTGIEAYSFDGTDLTHIDDDEDKGKGVHGDDDYIFHAGEADNLALYTFDGSVFTKEDQESAEAGDSRGVFWDGTYAYDCVGSDGMRAYTTDGSTLTKVATYTTAKACWDAWASGNGLVYVAGDSDDGLLFSFDGSTFTLENVSQPLGYGGFSSVFGGDDYVFFTGDGNGIFAYNTTGMPSGPTQTGENPADEATGQELSLTWNVTINDAEGDLLNVTIQCSKATAGGSTWTEHAANYSFSVSISGCDYSTEYTVYVNATDYAGSATWSNATYTFTTKANSAPVNDGPVPANAATGISLNPTLYINVTDADGDTMIIYFRTNASGSWANLQIKNSVPNGTWSSLSSDMDTLDTKYWWSANTTDGLTWDNDTYYFTTTDTSEYPVNSNPYPANAATLQPFNHNIFNITTTDPQGDTMDVSLWTNNTAGSTWVKWKYTNGVSNGTNSWVGSHDPYFTDLDPNTKYWWSANTTDSEGNWDNDTYYFTTNHSYSMSITKTANISTVITNDTVWDTQLVNYTINVTNTGTGDLTDININETWWNCSCSDWKFWFISTNEPNWETNLTVYTDSCYMSINITNLSVGESYELYILLNVSECAIDTLGTLRNWANVTATYATPKSSHCDIAWGEVPVPSTDLDIDALAVTIVAFISVFVALACIGLFIRWLGEVMR